MAEVKNPVHSFRIDLPRRKYLRCVVWENVTVMRDNVGAEEQGKYVGLFLTDVIGVQTKGTNCIGTLHLAATDLSTDTRSHELSHALDQFIYVLTSELRAQATGRATAALEAELRRVGLLS